ncbi:hydantoinase/oxoprolinase family protein [Xanthobacter sp. DSM 24535]|uniref:hydantoinase/oxoprolinase family protein n=1 Tax=Roseixanthobacter psychrophilus TaxID=3119917 RepID=UPI00372A6521
MQHFYASSDIGGTFTDTTVLDGDGVLTRYKSSTVPSDPVKGVLATFELAAEARQMGLGDFLGKTRLFSHGTTIATNSVLTRNGARVGAIHTQGFGDTLFIMKAYKSTGLDEAARKNFRKLTKPTPFLDRTMVREVPERVDYKGDAILALDEVAARLAVKSLIAAGAEAIAVSLLWSFKFPKHEQRIKEIILEEAPDMFVTLSSDILPRLGEYARSQTAVLNAFLGPKVKKAMTSLDTSMRGSGLPREPLLMRSNGGVMAAGKAADEAVGILLSGPVGGVVGAQLVGQMVGSGNVISTDMGGTSFDVGLIVDGRPLIQRETFMERQPLAVPSVTVDTIGAGGGSIAFVENGRLRVGPESAGAVPGPVCYGAGGTDPTVTDADVVLGVVNPDNFLGGRMKLKADLARKAIEEKIAKPLGISVEEAASGIKRIVDSHMADLVRQATVHRGYDPRDFVLVAFGGAGPTHAYSYGADLGVKCVIVPRTASVLSAHGILISDLVVTRETSQSLISPPGSDKFSTFIKAGDINSIFEQLQSDAMGELEAQGILIESVRFERYVDMRFRPQIFDLSVDLSTFPLADPDVDALVEHFIESYEARFGSGSSFRTAGIDMSAFRLVAVSKLNRVEQSGEVAEADSSMTPTGSRRLYEAGTWYDAAIYDERAVKAGGEISGPAIVELDDTTMVIGPAQKASVDRFLNIIIKTN